MSLPISGIVNVNITISATPTPLAGFGQLLFLTDEVSATFPLEERVRTYLSLSAVTEDWDVSSEVYKAASAYYAQNASVFMVGQAASTDTAATLRGGTPATVGELLTVSAGGFTVNIDGAEDVVTGVDLTSELTYDDISVVITDALASGTCTHDGERFIITSALAGAGSSVSFLSAGVQDLDVLLALTDTSGAEQTFPLATETAAEALVAIENVDSTFYGIVLHKQWRDSTNAEEVALYAEGSSRIFFNTSNQSVSITADESGTIYDLKQLNLLRTLSHYSSHPDQYPSAAVAGRAFIVNFEGVDTTITLYLKGLAGITTERLTTSQQGNLEAKSGNAFVSVGGNAVYSDSRMSDNTWFDTVHGIDWLQNRVETDVFNLLLTTPTKIPYTDAGVSVLIQAVEGGLRQGITNGLLAPGLDTTGKYLPLGYEIKYVPVSDVSPADKGNRQYNGLSFNAVGAGALHKANISGTFNE